jgi:hypothetical protein
MTPAGLEEVEAAKIKRMKLIIAMVARGAKFH